MKQHPKCCYCGGDVDSESIDHAPPKSFFRDSHRPKGLEVPACKHCNRGHSNLEEFFSYIAFLQLSAKENHIEPRLDSMLPGLVSRFPDAITDIVLNTRNVWLRDATGLIYPMGVTSTEDPSVPYVIGYMAARMACALIYDQRKQIAPLGSTFMTYWASNAAPSHSDLVAAALKFPEYCAIAQGDWNTSDQFEAHFAIENASRAVFTFNFHRSFLVCCVLGVLPRSGQEGPLFTVTRDGIAPMNCAPPPSLRILPRR